MTPKDHFELFQMKLLAAGKAKAGSWNKLASELPLSPSHLLGLRNGSVCLGGESLIRLLQYLNLHERLAHLVNIEEKA